MSYTGEFGCSGMHSVNFTVMNEGRIGKPLVWVS